MLMEQLVHNLEHWSHNRGLLALVNHHSHTHRLTHHIMTYPLTTHTLYTLQDHSHSQHTPHSFCLFSTTVGGEIRERTHLPQHTHPDNTSSDDTPSDTIPFHDTL